MKKLKKLVLKKETIVDLSKSDMDQLKGGTIGLECLGSASCIQCPHTWSCGAVSANYFCNTGDCQNSVGNCNWGSQLWC